MRLRILLLTVYTGFSLSLAAQPVPFPKYYFRNPLGIPMELQANFGELRPDHWHMGLDIRTNQEENLPVYAAAEGYIASIGVRPQSFGRFIIINHPNGLSTLYGHLNDFFPELEQYVTEKQYKQESWAIELNFTKDQFPVSKGQFIAYSGNTGGSQGPHLHFEIMNTKTEERMNPLLFGLPVEDYTPPSIVKLAMYDRGRSVYDQTPVLFAVKNTDSGYVILKLPVIKTGLNRISFAVEAYDRMNSKTSKDGIYSAELFFDDESQAAFKLDSISYDETVYINSQIDFKFRQNGGAWLQHLSKMPGDQGTVYKETRNNGIIDLTDTSQHSARVEIKDAYNNAAELNFIIQHDDSLAIQQTPANKGYSLVTRLLPSQKNEIRKNGFEMDMPPALLYDTVSLIYFYRDDMPAYAVTGIHQLNDATIPLHENFTLRMQPGKPIPADWKDKLVIQRSSRGTTIKKANWDGKWLTARFGDFGSFQAFVDVIPPQVNDPDSHREGKGDTVDLSPASRIVFTPTDNFGVIKNFRAELDSQWIRFTNDKGRNWIYKFDERCPYGVHHLKVTVEDLVGNTTIKEWWFKRYPYTPPPKKKKAVKKGSGKRQVASGKNKKNKK
jgi:hypothetical protein